MIRCVLKVPHSGSKQGIFSGVKSHILTLI
jgi:hypothetical protein